MNGKLHLNDFVRQFSAAADEIKGVVVSQELTTEQIRELMTDLTERLIAAAENNPQEIARVLLHEGAYVPGHGHVTKETFATNKILTIKVVREKAGCNLREAKMAVEQELPAALAAAARKTLKALEAANQVAGPTHSRYINCNSFPYALADTEKW